MDPAARVEFEQRIRDLHNAGRLEEAATQTLEVYGPEILGFLTAQLGQEADADDAFAQTCADLWAGLGNFEWRSSLRTWLYTVARNAAARLSSSPHRRPQNNLGVSQLSEVADRVRTRTAPFLRTEIKDAFARIRASLDPDDRALLMLRVDRDMDWKDIALVLFPDEASRSPGDLSRLTARLRKRFQAVKEDVRAKAKAAGILEP